MSGTVVRSRAALAGNPSDGYEGAVLSIPVPTLSVQASVGHGGVNVDLVDAAIRRFSAEVAPIDSDVSVTFETTIPRSVGLAGSSAIVIATLRELARHAGARVDDVQLAQLAHAIERVDLGIAGGWQDQLCQVAGVPLLMDFTPPQSGTELRPGRNMPFFVAWSETAAEASGESHAKLRRSVDSSTPAIHELTELAHASAQAFQAGDVHGLKQAMTATLDVRFSMMAIHPVHREMAETVAALGAPCNFAGSGGAVVGIVPKDAARFFDDVHAAGLTTTTWEVEA
jgi:glucuronokinase